MHEWNFTHNSMSKGLQIKMTKYVEAQQKVRTYACVGSWPLNLTQIFECRDGNLLTQIHPMSIRFAMFNLHLNFSLPHLTIIM